MIKKITLLLIGTLLLNCGQSPEPKEILFVCTHGAARSPIAAAYFNKIAKEEGLDFLAIFRGTEPDSTLTKGTTEGLKKDGFKISEWKPELVSENDISNAHQIITFDCELPSNLELDNIEQWNGTPPISKDYEKARDIIREKVNHLVERLAEK